MIAVLFSTIIFAQTTVTGSVSDEDNNPIPGANVVVDAMTGTVSDFDGNFSISVDQAPPFTITVSSVGFDSVTLNVSASNLNFNVQLTESQNLLDEIVVSASRIAERLFESPVTIEKFDYKDIAQSTGADFYSSLEGLKGVQINSGGLFLQQVNTRGFSTVYNNGFVQLVDGMNNEAPGLGFSAGNLLGIHELDIQSVELMPGAASALYGANATKGILFMNSKNPFDFPGVSATYRHGITSQEAAGENDYYDFAFRAANKFSDKFAAKITVSYQQGEDWHATDYRDINHLDGRFVGIEEQNPRHFPDYNGVNVYGDSGQTFNMTNVFRAVVIPQLVSQGLLSPAGGAQVNAIFANFSPNFFGNYAINASGYNENDLIDNKASSFKTDIALHYKPTEDSELILNSKIGSGNTMLHAANRNMLKNFGLQQHKIEYKNRNLGLRFYHTSENSGNTHDLQALGSVMVLAQPGGVNAYFGAYLNDYFTNLPSVINPNPIAGLNTIINYAFAGLTLEDLIGKNGDLAVHAAARNTADKNLLVPGSAGWNSAYDRAVTTGIDVFGGGAGILDTSQSNSFEVDYNLQDLIQLDGVDIIVGGSYRDYILRSNGTLFTDYDAPIEFNEMGVYAQAQTSLMDGAVKLTGSMRYDKSEFFEGTVTPRVGALIFLSENQNIRMSYQTGFQNPAAQDQYIGLDVIDAILVGGSPDNIDRFNMRVRGGSGNTYNLTGKQIQQNSFTLASVQAGAPTAAGDLGTVGPQEVESFELGYRVNGKKTALDIGAYYSTWDNFISAVNVITPLYGAADNVQGLIALSQGDFRVISMDSNTDEVVNTYGVSAGMETSILNLFDLSMTYSYNKMEFANSNSDYEAGFNTPENRAVMTFGSTKLADNFSFNVSAKYHDNFMYQQAGFIDAMIPANLTFDASMNFDLPSIDSKIKVGGTNLGGEEYFMIPGSGAIGSQFYVGFTINP